jgi:hypothetical protein
MLVKWWSTDGAGERSLMRLSAELHRLLDVLDGADAAPTTQVVSACADAEKALQNLMEQWNEIGTKEIQSLNERLRKATLPPLDR